MEFLLLQRQEKKLKIAFSQFAYQIATICVDDITFLKETGAHYNKQYIYVHSVIIDLSKSCNRINISSLCDEVIVTCLPGKYVSFTEFNGENPFIFTSYEGCLSDKWKVGNEVRQGGVTSGFLFKLYLNEVITDRANLFHGCYLYGIKLSILRYADDIAKVTPTGKALQNMPDMLAPKLKNLSLKINVEKFCNAISKQISK